MPMQMNGMDIVTLILHSNSIPLPLCQMKRRRSAVSRHRIRHSIDRPPIETLFCSIVFCKRHLECLVRLRCPRSSLGKLPVVPFALRRSDPLSLSSPSRILHHNSHPALAIFIVQIPEHPHSRMIHL